MGSVPVTKLSLADLVCLFSSLFESSSTSLFFVSLFSALTFISSCEGHSFAEYSDFKKKNWANWISAGIVKYLPPIKRKIIYVHCVWKTEEELPWAGLFPQCSPPWELTQNSSQVFHVGGKYTTTPRHRCWSSWKLDWKQSSWDFNQHSDMKCRCVKL